MNHNGLKMNPKKGQVVLIRKRGGDVPQPEFFIGPDSMKVMPKARYFFKIAILPMIFVKFDLF
jgi:hypothetical protein